jgi:hypothetical protein
VLPSELARKPHIESAQHDEEEDEIAGIGDRFSRVSTPAGRADPTMPILNRPEEASRLGLYRRLAGLDWLTLGEDIAVIRIHI